MNLNKYLYTEIVTVAIVVLCTIPVPEQAPMSDVPLIDKWVHMVMYGGLVFVMWVDRVVRNKQRFSWVARVVMLLYAAALGGAMAWWRSTPRKSSITPITITITRFHIC